MSTIVLCSGNRHKAAEIGALLAPLGYAVQALALDVVEDAPDFLGNAEKKARAALAATGQPALGDDSGLEVDALKGAPGVRSARWAGEPCDDAANNAKLLRELSGVPDERRGARFVCALVLVTPNGGRIAVEGICTGRIGHAPRGHHGFGYDPLFWVGEIGRTMAELEMEEKNRLSHRAHASTRLVEVLASGAHII